MNENNNLGSENNLVVEKKENGFLKVLFLFLCFGVGIMVGLLIPKILNKDNVEEKDKVVDKGNVETDKVVDKGNVETDKEETKEIIPLTANDLSVSYTIEIGKPSFDPVAQFSDDDVVYKAYANIKVKNKDIAKIYIGQDTDKSYAEKMKILELRPYFANKNFVVVIYSYDSFYTHPTWLEIFDEDGTSLNKIEMTSGNWEVPGYDNGYKIKDNNIYFYQIDSCIDDEDVNYLVKEQKVVFNDGKVVIEPTGKEAKASGAGQLEC